MNTQGVRASIDISAKDNGLDEQIQNVVKLNIEIQKLAQAMSKSALQQQKVATETAKTNTQNEKTATQMAKTIGQHQKNAAAKEQEALKTQKLRIQIDKLNNSSKKTTNSMSLFSGKLFLLGENFSNIAASAKNLANKIYNLSESAASYIETQNLFEVSMGDTLEKATKFVNEMSEAFNLNDEGLKKSVGTFNLLGTQMGLTADQAYLYSETLTKLSADMASLRNSSVDVATSKLKSGIVGEVEALRQWGIDVSEATLKQEALANGITKSYDKMTYGEKSLLRYSAILRQTTADQGDFARTLESPAQLMKQFREQLAATGRAIGTLFLKPLQSVLPVLIAILMVIRHIAEWLAVLFGISGDFGDDTANTSLEIAEGTSNALGDAVNNAKQLKKYLGGFDELNNVTPTTGSSGGASVGVGGIGIDDEFLSLLKGYDNQMLGISNKATSIRDRIMEWLGFTKEVDEETGKVSFKFDHITGGTVLGGLAVGGVIFSGVAKVYGFLKKIGLLKFPNLTGLTTIFSKIGTWIGGTSAWKIVAGSVDDVAIGLSGWANGAWSFSEAWSLVAPALGKLALVVLIVIQIVVMLKNIVAQIKNIYNFIKEPTWENFITMLYGGLKSTGLVGELIVGIFEKFGLTVDNVSDKVKKFADKVKEKLEPIKKFVEDHIIEPFNEIKEGIKTAIDTIKEKMDEMTGKLDEIKDAWKDWWEEDVKPIVDKLSESWYGLKDTLVELGDKFKSFYDEYVKDSFFGKILEAGKGLSKWFTTDFFPKIVDGFVGRVKNILNLIFIDIEGKINGIIAIINSIISKTNKITGSKIEKVTPIKLPRLKTGMDFVPSDYFGPVYLDYGERVLTKEENQNYMKGLVDVAKNLKLQNMSIKKYETGGIPDIGSLFVAGEGRTTEFVGDIGGRTNVVNETQLENALYNAMIRANKNKSEGATVNEIYIGGNKTDTILAKRSQRNSNILGKGGLAYNG